jgi:hypothetical protein
MNRRVATVIVFVTAMSASVLSVAADSDRPMGSSKERQGMHEKQGMQGMEGMMGMMRACPMMGGGGMMGPGMGAGMMPQLPPGNEKLQLQMSAEIMQKVGEITAKYANQIK